MLFFSISILHPLTFREEPIFFLVSVTKHISHPAEQHWEGDKSSEHASY